MIWHVHCDRLVFGDEAVTTSEPAAKLWASSEKGKYIVTQAGWLAPVLSCGNFVLVNDELYRFFSKYADGLDFEPAWIEDRAKQTRTDGYRRLFSTHTFGLFPDQAIFDTPGIILWLANDEYIFVSDELKQLLENTPIKGIHISPGFGQFVN